MAITASNSWTNFISHKVTINFAAKGTYKLTLVVNGGACNIADFTVEKETQTIPEETTTTTKEQETTTKHLKQQRHLKQLQQRHQRQQLQQKRLRLQQRHLKQQKM